MPIVFGERWQPPPVCIIEIVRLKQSVRCGPLASSPDEWLAPSFFGYGMPEHPGKDFHLADSMHLHAHWLAHSGPSKSGWPLWAKSGWPLWAHSGPSPKVAGPFGGPKVAGPFGPIRCWPIRCYCFGLSPKVAGPFGLVPPRPLRACSPKVAGPFGGRRVAGPSGLDSGLGPFGLRGLALRAFPKSGWPLRGPKSGWPLRGPRGARHRQSPLGAFRNTSLPTCDLFYSYIPSGKWVAYSVTNFPCHQPPNFPPVNCSGCAAMPPMAESSPFDESSPFGEVPRCSAVLGFEVPALPATVSACGNP
jgi:hypothetical protein